VAQGEAALRRGGLVRRRFSKKFSLAAAGAVIQSTKRAAARICAVEAAAPAGVDPRHVTFMCP